MDVRVIAISVCERLEAEPEGAFVCPHVYPLINTPSPNAAPRIYIN